VICSWPGMTRVTVNAAGAAARSVDTVAVEAVPAPLAFDAVTDTVYVAPELRPVSVAVVAGAATSTGAGTAAVGSSEVAVTV